VKFLRKHGQVRCCDVPYDGFARYPFWLSMFFGRFDGVRAECGIDLKRFHLIGAPAWSAMACGWGAGACLTEHQMRTHFRSAEKARDLGPCAPRLAASGCSSGQTIRDCGARSKGADVRWGANAMRLALRSQAYGHQIARHFTECWSDHRLSSAILTRAARSKMLMSLQVSGNGAILSTETP